MHMPSKHAPSCCPLPSTAAGALLFQKFPHLRSAPQSRWGGTVPQAAAGAVTVSTSAQLDGGRPLPTAAAPAGVRQQPVQPFEQAPARSTGQGKAARTLPQRRRPLPTTVMLLLNAIKQQPKLTAAAGLTKRLVKRFAALRPSLPAQRRARLVSRVVGHALMRCCCQALVVFAPFCHLSNHLPPLCMPCRKQICASCCAFSCTARPQSCWAQPSGEPSELHRCRKAAFAFLIQRVLSTGPQSSPSSTLPHSTVPLSMPAAVFIPLQL